MMLSKLSVVFAMVVTLPMEVISASLGNTAVTCQPKLTIENTFFEIGDEIPVRFEQCKNAAISSHDFVAIYPAGTDVKDIKGDANYVLWMWTCGTQFCQTPYMSNTVTFGPTQNRHTWPLPPGSYQAHLVKRFEDRRGRAWYTSVGATPEFVVRDSTESAIAERSLFNEEEEGGKCLDKIEASNSEFLEGDAFAILIQNECGILREDDWFGIYPASSCSENAVCQGEPLLWAWGCRGQGCSRVHTKFLFQSEPDEASEKGPLLETGAYRVILVTDEVDKLTEEGGPYQARLMSNTFVIYSQQETTHVIWRAG